MKLLMVLGLASSPPAAGEAFAWVVERGIWQGEEDVVKGADDTN